jgi:hypothetical protein
MLIGQASGEAFAPLFGKVFPEASADVSIKGFPPLLVRDSGKVSAKLIGTLSVKAFGKLSGNASPKLFPSLSAKVFAQFRRHPTARHVPPAYWTTETRASDAHRLVHHRRER